MEKRSRRFEVGAAWLLCVVRFAAEIRTAITKSAGRDSMRIFALDLKRLVLISLVLAATSVDAQTTAFSYQGKLTDGGTAANGPYDLEFKLFDAVSAGNQIGTTLQLASVPVTNGGFTVELDFGDTFPGAARYLEIGVSPQGQGNYTTLSPRQRIRAAPYAVKSMNADSSANAGNSAQLGGVTANQYVQTTDARLSDARTPLPGSSSYVQNTTTQQAGVNFNVGGDGTVGGTMTANNVRMGSSGQYHAPAGEENLRIVRGIINGDGTIQAGSGFTVTVSMTNKYTVTFTTPFPSPPTVTATARVAVLVNEARIATLDTFSFPLQSSAKFDISIYRDTGVPAGASEIHFIAVGPR